ncbi:putative polyol transporter 4-like [Hibiscus syriacus]|uniref:Polyol transporter 4-like n=1 Tax=Hibiscus syriacus TaxID=106335 RepID=A0A6A2ZEK2_HIBSY|nr:putative polyol transporter 4-like [Hibiscus syriacus]
MLKMIKHHPNFQHTKTSFFGFLFLLPTSLFALSIILLLAFNGFSVYYIYLPGYLKSSPEPIKLLPENLSGEKTVTKLVSSVMYAVKEENPSAVSKTQLVQKPNISMVPRPKQGRSTRQILRTLGGSGTKAKGVFASKVKAFFQNSKCKSRFFMTWISSIEALSDRELLAIESVFKSHPKACLVIVSNSLDSKQGNGLLKPFLDLGFKLISVHPDFDYIFKNTYAETWFDRLKKGNVDPGEVSLGQNLSNLLRLALLYKYGGIYIDTDVLVLKSFDRLRNVISAQSIDPGTKNWSRLNNAVLIFDENHPLLFKFIQEFALTFDGNRWGHNGPYLVSRVVARVSGRPGFNFKVLPPSAFYPVDWTRIRSLFQGPKNHSHSNWLNAKLKQIRRQSYAIHLWNRQSKKVEVEEGSIIDHIISDRCVFCNTSKPSFKV